MANRTRKIILRFAVTPEEREWIEGKMKRLSIRNTSAYLRRMAIDGSIVQVNYDSLKAVAAEVNKIGTNINQIAHRVNTAQRVCLDDMAALQGLMEDIWRLLKSKLSEARSEKRSATL